MEAYYYGKYHPSDESNTKKIYKIRRRKNLNNRQNLDASKLANVRREILRDKRLTDTELSQIEETAKKRTPERNVEPVLIMENLENEEIDQVTNKIEKVVKIVQQEEQADKIEQENYELEPETKEIKKEILREIHQIKYMKIEEREKLCKIRWNKKAKILINRAKIATKEILCECEETLEIMNKLFMQEFML